MFRRCCARSCRIGLPLPRASRLRNETGGSMNARSSTRFGKLAVVTLILMGAAAVWIPRQRGLRQSRIALANAKARRAELEEHVITAATALESARREVRGQKVAG